MKKLISIIFLFGCLHGFSQSTCIGFSLPNCTPPPAVSYSVSTFYNSGGGSGFSAGFYIYKNGAVVYQATGFGQFSRIFGGLHFINDSTGFLVSRYASGVMQVNKTINYGNTWTPFTGGGGQNCLRFYVVNEHNVYLVTSGLFNAPYDAVMVTKCSDIPGTQNDFIKDIYVDSDIYVMDTILNNSFCNVDSLNIYIKNNSDTITYHINSSFPLLTSNTKISTCNGSSIKVPYSIGDTFNPGNTFTAQLSDSSGSFSSPVNVGSLSSIVADTISVTIPSSTIIGNNYRLRVVSSDPPHISMGSGTHISIGNFVLPTLTVTSSGSLCIGSTTTLTATGASTYTWSTGSTQLSHSFSTGAAYSVINVAPLMNTTYTVTGSNTCGTSTETITVMVDPSCSYVWPGDANSDGIVNTLDVLELGLHYNQTGTPRATISNNWQAYYADTWTGTISNGENLCNSDCNGDGVININDTLAISNNYTNSYSSCAPQANPQLTIVPNQATVDRGKWGSASVYLGNSSNPMAAIYGLAFTVSFSGPVDSFYIDYPSSFLNAVNQTLNFRKRSVIKKLYAAITNTNNINVNGYGKIAELHYKIDPSISTNLSLNICLLESYKSNASGVVSTMAAGSGSLMAIGSFVGISEISGNDVFLMYPNPTSDKLTIEAGIVLKQIEICDVTGRIVYSQACSNKIEIIDLHNFSVGIYIVHFVGENGANGIKKLIVED